MSKKLEGLGNLSIFSHDYEFKVRQMLISGMEETLSFAIYEDDGKLVRPYEENMCMVAGHREYIVKFRLRSRDVEDKLRFSTVTGWMPAGHMVVCIKK